MKYSPAGVIERRLCRSSEVGIPPSSLIPIKPPDEKCDYKYFPKLVF
jgi:hypothetical protein